MSEMKIRDGVIIVEHGEAALRDAQEMAKDLGLSHLEIRQMPSADEALRAHRQARHAHVYAGEPDARQSMDPNFQPSRFRPQYRPLAQEEKDLHDRLKTSAALVEALVEQTPAVGIYREMSLLFLEISVMLAVKGLTA